VKFQFCVGTLVQVGWPRGRGGGELDVNMSSLSARISSAVKSSTTCTALIRSESRKHTVLRARAGSFVCQFLRVEG